MITLEKKQKLVAYTSHVLQEDHGQAKRDMAEKFKEEKEAIEAEKAKLQEQIEKEAAAQDDLDRCNPHARSPPDATAY